MALKKELQEILDELEFDTPEEKAEFEKFLAKDKVAAKIEAGYMKNRDYTTKTQALADARKQFEATQEAWNQQQDTYLQTLNTYKGDMETRLNNTLSELSKAKVYGAALETKIQKIAAEYGADPDELLADVKEMRGTKEPAKQEPQFNEDEFGKKFVSRDDFQKVGDQFFSYPVQMRDFEREYFRLFGKEYDGSLSDLVKEASVQVNQLRARGNKDIDLFGYMRQKLDFDGQRARNAEAAKVKDADDRKKWEEEKAKEIETRLRSEIIATNPALAHQPQDTESWRQNLTASGRKQAQQPIERPRTAQDTLKRQQSIHRAYEEQATKQGNNNSAAV